MAEQTIIQLISSVGFPIVACGALFYMINNTLKEITSTLLSLQTSISKLDNEIDYLKEIIRKERENND